MSDQFSAWDVRSREYGSGADFASIGSVPAAGPYLFDDTRPVPAAGYEYRLGQVTSNNVTVPYNDVHLTQASGSTLWAKLFGPGPSAVTGVAMDSSGNTVICGWFQSTVDLGLGQVTTPSATVRSIFVSKWSTANTCLWVKTYKTLQTSQANAIAVDADNNVLITGSVASERLAPTPALPNPSLIVGTTYRIGIYNAPDDFTNVGASSNAVGVEFIATGPTPTHWDTSSASMLLQAVDFGNTPITAWGDVFVLKVSGADGSEIWAKHFGSGNQTIAGHSGFGIACDSTGKSFIAGNFVVSITFGNTVLSHAGQGIFITGLLSNGAVSWAVGHGGTAQQFITGVARDLSGNILVTGYASTGGSSTVDVGAGPVTGNSNERLFLVKYSSTNGAYLWSIVTGSGFFVRAHAVACDPITGITVWTGGFHQNTSFVNFGGADLTHSQWNNAAGGAAFLVAFDSNNNLLWQWAFANGGQCYGFSIAFDGQRNIYVVGKGDAVAIASNGSVQYEANTHLIASYSTIGASTTDGPAFRWSQSITAFIGNGNRLSGVATKNGVVVTGGFIDGRDDFGGGYVFNQSGPAGVFVKYVA